MNFIITLLILWAVSAPLNYIIMRQDHIASFGKWKRIDRIVALSFAVVAGFWGLVVIGIAALFIKLSETAWANREAKW